MMKSDRERLTELLMEFLEALIQEAATSEEAAAISEIAKVIEVLTR